LEGCYDEGVMGNDFVDNSFSAMLAAGVCRTIALADSLAVVNPV